MRRTHSVIAAFAASTLVVLGSACATPPAPESVAARPLQPGPGEVVELDQLLLIVDASASIPEDTLFLEEKVLVVAYVDSMPEGSYETGAVAFGGFDRHRQRLSPFARSEAREYASETRHLREGTPLHKVFEEERETFASRSGRAAVVIFTDGLTTDEFGRDVPSEHALNAASELAKAYPGRMCFHTVQLGEEVAGREFLRSLSEVTDCGSFRTASMTANERALHTFHREVFIARAVVPALPPVAAAPPESCPGTPSGVPVDADGCWQLPAIDFAFDSAVVDEGYRDELNGVAEVLQANPDTRLVIDGYTDSLGDSQYNRQLSIRRAQATKEALVSSGVDEDRLAVSGWGEENPVRENDSLENRRLNRRTQLRVDR